MTTDSPKGGFEELLLEFKLAVEVNAAKNVGCIAPCPECDTAEAKLEAAYTALKAHNEGLERELDGLRDVNAQQAGRLLEMAGKHPKVSVVMGEVRVLGIQGPNQFDPLVMNASLVDHIMELQKERDELKAAIRAVNTGHRYCLFCRSVRIGERVEPHKPDCIWTRCEP